MMLRFISAAAAALLAGGMVSGCCTYQCPAVAGSRTVRKTDGLFQKEWKLKPESLSDVPADAEKPQREITMRIEPDGRISGSSGVNRYFGTIRVDSAKGKIDFQSGAIGSTRMAGPGMAYENAFYELLKRVDSFEIREGRLLLKSADKIVAELQSGL